jgi:hypothetical protein
MNCSPSLHAADDFELCVAHCWRVWVTFCRLPITLIYLLRTAGERELLYADFWRLVCYLLQTADEYRLEYDSRRGSEYSRFHGYTYDGIWAVALAIQHVARHIRRVQENQTVADFRYRDPMWEKLFLEALRNTSFEGVTVRWLDISFLHIILCTAIVLTCILIEWGLKGHMKSLPLSSVMDTSRLRLKCDGTRAETRFRLSAKRTSPLKSAEVSLQPITGSRGVRISVSNAGYTVFRGSVKSTGYPLHSPVSLSLPLPCFTVCHHISTGLRVL